MVMGAAAGAIGALLYAPKSGRETRNDIRDATKEAGRKAGQAWGDLKHQASGFGSDVQHSLSDASDRCRRTMDDITARMRDAVKVGRRTAEEKLEELEGNYEESRRKVSRKAA